MCVSFSFNKPCITYEHHDDNPLIRVTALTYFFKCIAQAARFAYNIAF